MNARLLGAQLVSHQPYELSRPKMTRIRPDGLQDRHLELDTGIVTVSGRDLDVRIADVDDDAIVDTRHSRIDKRKCFVELVSAYLNDELLVSLVRSYDKVVRDPDNELVHLFEIREALAAEFGSDDEACKALGISITVWKRFGRLCNDKSLRQGRHRGQSGGALRDATEGEIAEARDIACRMIKAYLH